MAPNGAYLILAPILSETLTMSAFQRELARFSQSLVSGWARLSFLGFDFCHVCTGAPGDLADCDRFGCLKKQLHRELKRWPKTRGSVTETVCNFRPVFCKAATPYHFSGVCLVRKSSTPQKKLRITRRFCTTCNRFFSYCCIGICRKWSIPNETLPLHTIPSLK